MKAAAEFTQQGVIVKSHILEMQCADLARTLTHFVLFGATRNPFCVQRHDKNRHTAMAGSRIGTGENEADIGNWCVVNPDFAAVQYPA